MRRLLSIPRLKAWAFRRKVVSAATMVRLFNSTLGVSPKAYVQERRLQEAESLLKKGTPGAETAHIVGYQSPSAFCSAYRKRFGLAPSKIKRSAP